MQEITRIHLARTPYEIEIGAKKQLEQYLAAIKKNLSADDDTLYEIEARMVELLEARGVARAQIITSSDVAELEKQLGEPRAFRDDSVGDDDEPEAQSPDQPAPKRLMRDEAGGMIGGVSAGFAAYFGIDPVWARVIMVILLFATSGAMLAIYMLLWAVIPPAKTAAEKLQMHGKPVTLEALKSSGDKVGGAVQSAKKPLLMLVRIVLGLGFAAMALAILAALVMGVTLGALSIGSSAFVSQSPSLVLAGVAATITLTLLAAMCGLLSYMAFTWRINRRLVGAVSALLVAGLLVGIVTVATGAYAVTKVNQNVQSSIKTDSYPIDIAGITQASVESGSMNVRYIVSDESPRVAVRHIGSLDDVKKAVGYERQGSEAQFKIEPLNECMEFSLADNCIFVPEITIYGPALEKIDVKSGSVGYHARQQSTLDASLGRGVYFQISKGMVDQLNVTTEQTSCDSLAEESNLVVRGNEALTLNDQKITDTDREFDCLSISRD